MCLVALAIDHDRRFPLVVASNRDEFYARPAARLGWWTPAGGGPAVLGGRDLESGGTWMGLTQQGRFAFLTNVRDPKRHDAQAPTRGSIVPDWLSGRDEADRYWMRTALSGHNGFNLVAADFTAGECFWASSTETSPRRLARGIYGLSNGGLDTPWPKVVDLKTRLRDALRQVETVDALAARLFAALADREVPPDAKLPSTGVPIEWERALASAFVRSREHAYGTRCSTLVITERSGRAPVTHVFERTFSTTGGVALLRRASLRNWPPRYRHDNANDAQATVSESSIDVLGAALPPPRKTRVRSLLRPDFAPTTRPASLD